MSKEKAPIHIDGQDEFKQGKEFLLRYYSDLLSSTVTRLIGFVAGLFVLIQTVQTSQLYPIHKVFPLQPIPLPIKIPIPVGESFYSPYVRLFLFAGATFVLVLYIVRTIFRFAAFNVVREMLHEQVFSYSLRQDVLKEMVEAHEKKPSSEISLEELQKKMNQLDTQIIMYSRVFLDMRKAQKANKVRRVYLLPVTYFIRSELLGDETLKGWLAAIILSIVLTSIFVWILW